MRRLKRKILRGTAAGVALAAALGSGTVVGALGSVNVLAQDAADTATDSSAQNNNDADSSAQNNNDADSSAQNNNDADSSAQNNTDADSAKDERSDATQGSDDDSSSQNENVSASSESSQSNAQTGEDRVLSSVDATADIILNNISFSEDEIFEGSSITITADISNPENIERVKVQLVNEKTGDFDSFYMTKNSDGIFELRYSPETEAQYRLNFAEIEDVNGNKVTFGENGDKPFNFSEPVLNVRKWKIKSIKFDKTEAEPGDYIYATVDIETGDNKLVHNCDITLENSSGDILRNDGYNEEGKAYFVINKSDNVGEYHISYINISVDVDGYGYDISFSEEEIKNISDVDTLTVLEGDRTAPVINSVSVSPKEISLANISNASANIKVDVTDDKSGVDSIYVRIKDPDGAENSKYIDPNDNFEGYFNFNHSSKNGTYEITQITARDNAGNETTKTVSEKFTLKDSIEDKEGPVVKAIKFSKSKASPHEEVTVRVIADDESGLSSYASLYLKDKSGNRESVSLKRGENDILEGSFTVHDNWLNGDYEIGLAVNDKFGNSSEYGFNYYDDPTVVVKSLDSIPEVDDFAVENSKEDKEAPTVKSITFKLPDGKTVAEPGDEIEVTIEAEDNSDGTGLRAARFYFRNENGASTDDLQIVADENGQLKGIFTVGSKWDGDYALAGLRIFDNAEGTGYVGYSTPDNDRYYEADDLKNISNTFTVKGTPPTPKEDTEAPVLKSLDIELPEGKSTVSPGDKIRVVAEATDNKAESIDLYINNFDPTDSSSYIYLYKDEATGKYISRDITINDFWYNREYKINYAGLNDYNGNHARYDDKSYDSSVVPDLDLANIPGTHSFTVTGSKEDRQPPIVESFSMTKINNNGVENHSGEEMAKTVTGETSTYPVFLPGDKMTVSVRLADESDVSQYGNNMIIYLWDTNERTQTVSLTRQEDGTFAGELTVDDRWINSDKDNAHHNVRIYATDTLGNNNKDNRYLVGKIRIQGSKQDIYAPNIESVEISNATAKPGDTITVTAKLNDIMPDGQEGVGISPSSVHGDLALENYPFDRRELNFTKQPDGSYKADIKIDDSWYNAPYKLRISARDEVGNYVDNDTGKTLTVTGSKEDKQGPKVTRVSYDKKDTVPGDIISMNVEATDDSGIEDVRVVVYTEAGDDGVFYPVRGDVEIKPGSTGKLTAQIKIDNSFKNGTYKVEYIDASDILSNGIEYWDFSGDGVIKGNTQYDEASGDWVYDTVVTDEFTVSDSPGVYAAPKLKSIKFNNNSFAPGETVKVTAQLEDANEKIDSVDITIGEGEAGEKLINVTLYPTADGLLEGEFSAPDIREWNPDFKVLSAFVAADNDARYYSYYDGEWDEDKQEYVEGENYIGKLDTNTFTVKQDEENTDADADYSKVDEAISYIPLALDNYTEDSIAVLNDALKSVVRNKPVSEQSEVDAYADAIQKAIDALVPKDSDEPAEYRRVDEAIARAPEDKDIYTPESLKALEDAINAVERGKNINEQPKVNDYARAINEAVRNLEKKPADYTKTDEAIKSKPADTGIYTEESVKRLEDAIAAVVRDKKIDEQADVDTFAEEIKKAINALELKEADYTAVEDVQTKVPSEAELTKYTEDSVKALKDAVAAVVEGKKADEQQTVDNYAKAIEDAIAALEEKKADYTEVDKKISEVPADLSEFTQESAKAVSDAIAAVQRGLAEGQQTTVDDYAKAIAEALARLELKPADYSSVETAKQSAPAGAELDKYTPESVAALQKAIAGVEEGKKITEQAAVDEYARAIDVAVIGLELKDADYSAVDAAKEKVPSDEELSKYTDESVKALKDAIAAVSQGKKIDEQSKVDDYAKAIEAAIAALEEKADAPSKPVDNPTEPVDTPTEPVEKPTEPVDTPTEPVDKPSGPAEDPSEQEKPTEPETPVDNPTEPIDNPSDPADTPTEPGVPDNEDGKSEADANTSGGETDTQDDNTDKTGADSKESEKDSISGEKQANTTEKTGEATNTGTANTAPVSNSGATAAGGASAAGSVASTGTAGSVGSAVQPVQPVQATQTTQSTQTTTPETGDKNHTPIWITAAGAAAAALAGVVVRRKKKTEK